MAAKKKAAPKKRARKKAGKKRKRPASASPKNIPAMAENIWQPGESGNPKGRPPRVSLESVVESLMDETIGKGADQVTRREALGAIIVDELMRRDSKMMKAYLDRVWPEEQKHDVKWSGPVQVVMDEDDLEA